MATITPTITRADHTIEAFWETLTEADTAAAVVLPRPCPLGSIVAVGTWGSATLILQGSIDGTNWFGLTDQAGNAVSLTANGGDVAVMPVRYIRPSASGGTGQDLDIRVLAMLPPERSA